jgi:hypothetical protein
LLRKNHGYIFFLIILLFISVNILNYDNLALGSGDNDNNGNNKNDDSDDKDDDRKDKEEKKNDDYKDDDPFILPLPFP